MPGCKFFYFKEREIYCTYKRRLPSICKVYIAIKVHCVSYLFFNSLKKMFEEQITQLTVFISLYLSFDETSKANTNKSPIVIIHVSQH